MRSSLSVGIRRMMRTPRLIVLAWTVNLLLALIIALPVFTMLDDALRTSVYEQTLMEQLDQNWWLTFKEDHINDPFVRVLDLSIMGAAPFFSHLETMLHGGIAVPIRGFLSDLVLRWSVPDPGLSVLVFLGLLGALAHTVLSAGFISAYRGDYPPTISQFLSDGMLHFAPFARLLLLVLLVQGALLYPLVSLLGSWIAAGTQNASSEMIPFVLYMGRNLIAFVLFFLLVLSADYARIHIVLQKRTGAAAALAAGIRFVFSRLRVTWGIGILLVLATFALMALYWLLEFLLPKNTALMVLILFGLHQAYMLGRSGIRAMTYAAEVDVFQTSGIRS